MTENEDFDKIIRQKFAEKQFVFNEENWEKVERKMDSSRKVNKFFRWTAVFAVGLCSGIAVMMPFVIHTDRKTADDSTFISSELKPGREIAEIAEKKNVTGVSQQHPIGEIKEMQYSVSPTTSSETDMKDQLMVSVGTGSEKLERKSGNPAANPSIRSGKTTLTEGSMSDINLSQERIQRDASAQLVLTPSEKNSKASNVIARAGLNAVLPDNAKNISSLSDNKQSATQVSEFVQQTESVKETTSEKTDVIVDSGKQLLAETPSNDNTPVGLDLQVYVPAHPDSSSPSPLQNTSVQSQSSLSGLSSTNIISIDAGVNCNLGWNYHDTIEARGFNPIFGIGFTHYFNSKWALNSGIQYGSMVNFNASKKEFSSTKYDFGYSLIDTVVNTRSLYYAMLPLQLQYCFNNKNSVGIGGTISYLVNVKSDMTVYSRNSFGISGMNTNTQFGFMSGFSQWDVSVSVAYRRRITEKLTIAALTNYGLFDIKSDVFFSKQKFERNLGLKLMLTYDLFQY